MTQHLMNLIYIIKWTIFHNSLKTVAFPGACAPLATTFFPPPNFLLLHVDKRPLWTTNFFNTDIWWLTFLVEGNNDKSNTQSPHDFEGNYMTKIKTFRE